MTLARLQGALVRTGRHEEALMNLKEWLTSHPEDTAVRLRLASAYESLGKPEQALVEYERVLFTHPENPLVLNNLAWIYHHKHDPRALGLAARAYEQSPRMPAIADTYGWLLAVGGKVQQGLDVLARARQQMPKDPAIRFHHAAALAMSGASAQARDELRALLATGHRFAERERAEELLSTLQ